jgi:hypothetical protein
LRSSLCYAVPEMFSWNTRNAIAQRRFLNAQAKAPVADAQKTTWTSSPVEGGDDTLLRLLTYLWMRGHEEGEDEPAGRSRGTAACEPKPGLKDLLGLRASGL